MALFLKLNRNYFSKMHGYPIFSLDTNGTYKDLLSMDSFKPHKNNTVFVSITDRKTRVSRDAQDVCGITIVGTALKLPNIDICISLYHSIVFKVLCNCFIKNPNRFTVST